MILLNGQWQGGADKITLSGLNEIKSLYLDRVLYEQVPIEKQEKLKFEDEIIGLSEIKKQTKKAFQILIEKMPKKLFTIGGGCDADVASVAYLNKVYQGDLCILWFDAHGDINSPNESETHLFYGMPARALLGCCNKAFDNVIHLPLKMNQLIQIGGRAFDDSESAYIKKNKIKYISDTDADFTQSIQKAIESTEKHHCYIHLDLDVLNPTIFPYVPLPESGGISFDRLKESLELIRNDNDVVGFGLYEFAPQQKRIPEMEWLIKYGISISESNKI